LEGLRLWRGENRGDFQPLAFADSGRRLRIQAFPRQKGFYSETREISRGFYSLLGWSDEIEGLRSLKYKFRFHAIY